MRPHWPDQEPPSAASDLAACRDLLRAGSRTFLAASRTLPRRVADPAAALYAFCRLADDAVDLQGEPVERLRMRLYRAYAGRPLPTPSDRALADVVARHGIPIALPEALLEGLAWDAEGRRYCDLAGLHAYAARVAGSVGAMMAMLMGVRSPAAVARACELGIAMQLSNIARDVGEDARRGRLYLPLQWLRAAGIDPDAWLARPVFSPALGSVVRDLLVEADRLYAKTAAGIAALPWTCRPGIDAARLLYAEIGREVERRGLDSVSSRAVVPVSRKFALVARSLLASLPRANGANRSLVAPSLEATRFLIEAVAGAPEPHASGRAHRAAPWAMVDRRAAWLIDLFMRLEERGPAGS